MPMSLDPEPGEDEIECARCGAHFSIELTRCPNCGVNLYEPEEDAPDLRARFPDAPKIGMGKRMEEFFRRLTRKPYTVDEVFGTALRQAELFKDLLARVGGDRAAAERLVEFERQQDPRGNRIRWLEKAIQRWEKDNQVQN